MAHTHPDTAGTGGAAGEELSERRDDLFEALAHRYRRFVLVYLHGADSPVSPRTLAEAIAARVDETSGERVLLLLHHTHLPKLAAAGCVEYDDDVRLADAARPALDLLDRS